MAEPAATVDVAAYIHKDIFNSIKISPTGEYYAATVPQEDRTSLVILRRSDNSVTAKVGYGKNTHVIGFWWVNPTRVLVSIAEQLGSLDQPQSMGELYAINADGTHADTLVGVRADSRQTRKNQMVAAELVDTLPDDDQHVVISAHSFSDPNPIAELMDVYSGRRTTLVRSPAPHGSFVTDDSGVVRFASGSGADNNQHVYYRAGADAPWQQINDQSTSGHEERPIGFSADGKTAFLQVEQQKGPDAIVAFDPDTGTRKEVLRDDDTDPYALIRRPGSSVPVGALFMDGTTRTAFFDNDGREAKFQRSLEAAFPNSHVVITSQTTDGKLLLLQVSSDRAPGTFYVFDTQSNKAEFVSSRGSWFDPKKLATRRPVSVTTRDGLTIHGYLTVPSGSEGKNLPMVVNPHGGPFGIQDIWAFDIESQMLADAGYAVLQVNFRGSGGYGRAFQHAGALQWGKTMQDDLTDATRWAIQQGIADASRICIYGASYGGYASLMGVAKEPDLYKCAVGYVGVYDLPMMYEKGDVQSRRSGETFLKEWLGDAKDVADASPNRLAGRIKAPVFLAAGGDDQRAPIKHSKLMETALKEAGGSVETLYFPNEGHGFYTPEHQREYYTHLLAFLSKYLGGAMAKAADGGANAAK
ncbi:alpha/beta hydrolase family protein [Lysobacter fragariae]